MSPRRAEESEEVFRPRRALGLAMAVAGTLWLAVLALLVHFQGVPLRTVLSAVFFVLFFAVSVTYYVRTAIRVDARGFTYQGILHRRQFSFSDIRKVDILPGLVTVYAVRSSAAPVHFTSFFARHRELAALLVERAGLAPVAG